MRIDKLTETEVAYIAGLIDGEGTINMTRCLAKSGDRKLRYRVRLTVVATTSVELLAWLYSKFGGSVYKVGRPKSAKHLQGWCLKFAEVESEKLLKRAIQYLVIKKRHAELFLQYREIQKACGHPGIRWKKKQMLAVREVRDWFFEEFRKLNAKGPVTVTTNTPETSLEDLLVKIEPELQGNLQRVSGDTAPPTVIQ